MDSSKSRSASIKEELLISYIEGNASENEDHIIKEWLKNNPQNEEMLMHLAKIHFAYRHVQSITQRDTISAYNSVKKKISRKKYKNEFKRIAFSFICLISILSTLSTTYLIWGSHAENEVGPREQGFITVNSNTGMRSNFYLPDGSMVYLNSGGSITYPTIFDKHERRIRLKGEAYFNVKNDPESPFYVDLPEKDVSIKVLGTEFNLEAYEEEDEVRTTLLSGKVSILLSDKYSNATREQVLQPQQKAIFNTEKETWNVNYTDGYADIGWTQGKLIFKDTKMTEVLRELSHFYDVEFHVSDKVIETYRFTGIFDNRQLMQILDYLEISSFISYSIKYFTPQEETVKKRTIITLKRKQT